MAVMEDRLTKLELDLARIEDRISEAQQSVFKAMLALQDRVTVREREHARLEDMLSAHLADLARRVDVISEGQQKMLAALLAIQDRIERIERGGTDLAVMSGFGKMLHRDMS